MTTHSLNDIVPLAKRLRLSAMLEHALELDRHIETTHLSHAEYLYELFSEEVQRRDERALKRKIQEAGLRYADACLARIDWDADRQLDRRLINTLASNDYNRNHQNIIITGATGCGKTWLADAFGQNACLAGYMVRHYRVNQLIREYNRFTSVDLEDMRKEYLSYLEKIDLLILDDWGIGHLDNAARVGLYEIIEQHRQSGSIIITSVLPVKHWAQYVNEPTLSDSILDRVVLSSHRIEMQGNSMRRRPEYGAIIREGIIEKEDPLTPPQPNR